MSLFNFNKYKCQLDSNSYNSSCYQYLKYKIIYERQYLDVVPKCEPKYEWHKHTSSVASWTCINCKTSSTLHWDAEPKQC